MVLSENSRYYRPIVGDGRAEEVSVKEREKRENDKRCN